MPGTLYYYTTIRQLSIHDSVKVSQNLLYGDGNVPWNEKSYKKVDLFNSLIRLFIGRVMHDNKN